MGAQHDPRGLSPFQLFNIAFGVAVGVGWIVVLGGWLHDAGPLGGALAFAVAAIFMLAIGQAYASLAIEYPVAGGEFAYAREVFGPAIAYWVGWFLAIAYISVIAFEMVSLAWIVRELFPDLLPAADPTRLFDLSGVAIGFAALVIVVLLSMGGSRSSARAQDVMVVTKVLLSLGLIIGGILGGSPANLQPLWGSHDAGPLSGVLAVFATAPFFFAGFGAVAQAMRDVRSPESIRLMPRVMTFVILGTGLFYILVIVSAAAAMNRDALLTTSLPAVAAFTEAFDSALVGRAVLLVGMLGVLTILNGVFFACARLLAALAEDNFVPAVFARANRQGAPIIAALFVAMVAMGLAAAGQAAIKPFLNVASAAIAGVMMVACITLIAVRRRRGEGRISGASIGALLAAMMVVVPLYEAARNDGFSFEWMVVLGWGAAGLLCWLFVRRPFYKATEDQTSWRPKIRET